jgi:hypothetical protein
VSQLILVTIEPAQRIAAEPDTFERFKQLLFAGASSMSEERPTFLPRSVDSVFGWPLDAEPRLPPGFVYLCPHPTTARADGLEHPLNLEQALNTLPTDVQQSLRAVLAAEVAEGLEQP